MYWFLNNKTVLITWGLWTIWWALVDEIFKNATPEQIRIVDNRENWLALKIKESHLNQTNKRYIFCDVRDKDRLQRAMDWVDIVYHAAAMKHVWVCELNPFDAVETNIQWTKNVIQVALDNNIESLTFISTDKSVNPTNTMWATKLIGERLIHSMYYYKGSNKTRFSAVRFGNVINSRWSVLDLWEMQRKEWKKLTVTDPNMTRFFMSISNAASLVVDASKNGKDGEIFILKMDAIKIWDLLDAYLKIHNLDKDNFIIIWKQFWEKMHEELILDGEAEFLYENNSMYVKQIKNDTPLKWFKKSTLTHFSSEEHLLEPSQVFDALSKIL